MGQIDSSADNAFYNVFLNTDDSATDNAVDNAVNNAVDANFELFVLNSRIIQDIMASEDPLFDRYVPMAYTALWPLQLLELTRAQTIKILPLVRLTLYSSLSGHCLYSL
jgi:hypothetical protein